MACAIDTSIGDRTPTVIIFYVIELSQNVTVTNGDLRNIDRLSTISCLFDKLYTNGAIDDKDFDLSHLWRN